MSAGALAVGLVASPAAAQPRPAPAAQAPTPKADPLKTALAPQPGGLTPDELAKAALKTRASLRVKQADLRAASAKVDQALVNFFPRVTVTATYTRLSEVSNSLGGGATVGVLNPGNIRVGPCLQAPTETCVNDSQGLPAAAQKVEFPVVNNSYSLTAGVALPVSDYVLRISQGYSAASHAESAQKLAADAEALSVASDAKITYYNWLRVKGQVVVAGEAVSQAKAHLADAKRTFEVGLISRADVLRLEAQVASAEQVMTEAQAGLLLADEQVRIALGAPPEKPLEVGVDLMASPIAASPAGSALPALQQEALQKRLEIRALDETEYSFKKLESVSRAGYFPRVDAFADFTYANPNQRYLFSGDEWHSSWDAGVRASWVLNDIFTTLGSSSEASARTEGIAAQKAALREGLRLEVASAYADVSKAASTIETAERQLAASEESMRVRTELFRAGRATTTDVVDSENELTRARLQQLNARIGAQVAKIKFDHVLGRDVNTAK